MLLPTVSTHLLAYGGWQSPTVSGMWAELAPHLLRDALPILVLYAIASAVTELPRSRWVGFAVYFIGVTLIPARALMGAPGAAHLSSGVTTYLVWLLMLCIFAKALSRPKWRPAEGRAPCARCGYDTSLCVGGRCSECGAAALS
jgi:hypothetical protein